MSFPPSKSKTYVAGETLTASDLNTSLSDPVNSNIPEDIDDYSATTTEMQVTTDPYPAGSPSLATSLSEELARLRYVIKQITGQAQWYVDPAKALTEVLALSGGTMSGNIAMGTNILTGLGAGDAAGESVRFEQLKIIKIASATNTTAFTTSSSTFQTTNLTISFTPSRSDSTMYVLAFGPVRNTDDGVSLIADLFADSNNLSAGGLQQVLFAGSAMTNSLFPCALFATHTPGSASAVTYSVKIRNSDNATTVGFGNGLDTKIFVMEVNTL